VINKIKYKTNIKAKRGSDLTASTSNTSSEVDLEVKSIKASKIKTKIPGMLLKSSN
jgi:hypothetical protein